MKMFPYLMFNLNCEEALNFYAKILDGKISDISRYKGSGTEAYFKITPENENKIMNCTFTAPGIYFLAADSIMDKVESKNPPVTLTISVPDITKAKSIFASLSQGGEMIMDFEKTFFSEGFGMCIDKFGITWQVIVQ